MPLEKEFILTSGFPAENPEERAIHKMDRITTLKTIEFRYKGHYSKVLSQKKR